MPKFLVGDEGPQTDTSWYIDAQTPVAEIVRAVEGSKIIYQLFKANENFYLLVRWYANETVYRRILRVAREDLNLRGQWAILGREARIGEPLTLEEAAQLYPMPLPAPVPTLPLT